MAKTDCVSCHMPKRRTQDVVHVVMTDHKIQKPQKPMTGAGLLAPREERDPGIAEIIAPPGAELYRTLASARAGKQVTIPPSSEIEPYFDLGSSQLRQKRFAEVAKTCRIILERAPG